MVCLTCSTITSLHLPTQPFLAGGDQQLALKGTSILLSSTAGGRTCQLLQEGLEDAEERRD